MLKHVHIQNVRSCRDVHLDNLGAMTVLVGRNGAGKTNILRAIQFAARNAVSQTTFEDPSLNLNAWAPPQNAQVALEFMLDGTFFRYVQRFVNPTRSKAQPRRQPAVAHETLESREGDILQGVAWRSILSREGEKVSAADKHGEVIQIGANAPCLSAVKSLLPQDDPLLKTIQPVVGYLSSIHYYPLDELNLLSTQPGFGTQIIRHTDYAQWLQTKNPGSTSSVLMRLIHMSQEMPEDFEQLKELLGENGLGILLDIKVETFTFPGAPGARKPEDKSDLIYFVQFFPNQSTGREIRTYDQISFGTRRLLRVLASMLHDKSLLTLIEQPEDGIHPGLLHKLIPMLKTNADAGQVIMASHSPAIFNRLLPEEIRLVEMRQSATRVRALTNEEIEGAKQFMSAEGPLSDFIETIEDL